MLIRHILQDIEFSSCLTNQNAERNLRHCLSFCCSGHKNPLIKRKYPPSCTNTNGAIQIIYHLNMIIWFMDVSPC